MAVHQLEFPASTESTLDFHWKRWRAELQAVVEEKGLKQVAYELDCAPSDISHALAGRERHYFRAEWALYLALVSRNDGAASYPARARGLEVREPEAMTPAQRVERLEAAVRLLGKAGQAILDDAYDDAPRRRR